MTNAISVIHLKIAIKLHFFKHIGFHNMDDFWFLSSVGIYNISYTANFLFYIDENDCLPYRTLIITYCRWIGNILSVNRCFDVVSTIGFKNRRNTLLHTFFSNRCCLCHFHLILVFVILLCIKEYVVYSSKNYLNS